MAIHEETLVLETCSGNNVACKNTSETLLPAKSNDDVPQYHVIPSFIIKYSHFGTHGKVFASPSKLKQRRVIAASVLWLY